MSQLYVAAFVSMLIYYNKIWHRHYLKRTRILPPHLLGVIYTRMVPSLGFIREAFEEMHDYLYNNEQEHRDEGRLRLLNNRDELGLIYYFCSSMKYSELCLLLGCTVITNRCRVITNHQLTFPSRDFKIFLDQTFQDLVTYFKKNDFVKIYRTKSDKVIMWMFHYVKVRMSSLQQKQKQNWYCY